MIQWEPEFVSEDDSSVIVRCDKPDNYNKTVSWSVASHDLLASVEQSSHPGEGAAIIMRGAAIVRELSL